jgi:hypothetical protein
LKNSWQILYTKVASVGDFLITGAKRLLQGTGDMCRLLGSPQVRRFDPRTSDDWANLGLPPDLATQAQTTQAKPKAAAVRRSAQQFLKFPNAWLDRLEKIKAKGCTYRVATRLLYRAWRTNRLQFDLANVALRERGISRHNKWTALRELETAGLVVVERRPRKSPVVHLLLCC